jgi:hypothetical protein
MGAISIFSPLGIRAVLAPHPHTISASVDRLGALLLLHLWLRLALNLIILIHSVSGPFTDQSGVSLLKSGGTVVLSSHDSVG